MHRRVTRSTSAGKYGEGLYLWDLKLAKNLRFGGRRINFGIDVYNLFNSDAALAYNDIYTATRLPDGTWVEDNPATPNVEVNNWGAVRQIMTPRLMKISLQFDF